MFEDTLPNGSNIGECPFRRVGNETMAPSSQHIEPLGLFSGQPTPRLYDTMIEAIRVRHDSRRAEQAYANWIRRFILFHGRHHPRELAEDHVNRFLTHLAVKERVAASTQNQALSGAGGHTGLRFSRRLLLRKGNNHA